MLGNAQAAEHTWIPRKHVLSNGTYGTTLPTITVTGHIDWGNGAFDNLSDSVVIEVGGGSGTQIAMAILSQRQRALALSDVCTNGAVSKNTKAVVMGTPVESRWLAAQDVFNSIQAAGLWSMYLGAYGPSGIGITIGLDHFQGFKLRYSDGSSETWMVNPGYRTSVVKLVQEPLPNSLTPPAPGSKPCTVTL